MDTERLGFDLAEAINEMLEESGEDIERTLGGRSIMVPWEYTALLLWIIIREAVIVMPEKAISPSISTTLAVVFSWWKDAEVNAFGDLGDDGIDLQKFEDYVQKRFDLYDWAWNVYSSMKDNRCSDEEIKGLSQASEITVAINFIVRCFGGEAEYHNIFPKSEDRTPHTACVLNYYRGFSERVRSILTRFASNEEQTCNSLLEEEGANAS